MRNIFFVFRGGVLVGVYDSQAAAVAVGIQFPRTETIAVYSIPVVATIVPLPVPAVGL
jgi:hypothetical protein